MEQEKGRVYIASFNYGGHYPIIPEDIIPINVTVYQRPTYLRFQDFSPLCQNYYKGFINFDAFWQSGKVYEGIPEEVSREFWWRTDKITHFMRGAKGKRLLYYSYNGEQMDYLTARKTVYIPLYHERMEVTLCAKMYTMYRDLGHNLVIYDIDGPRHDGRVQCLEVTEEFLIDKVNSEEAFGHGYIVAAYLAGIPLEKWCI